jgi:hypothetical protein
MRSPLADSVVLECADAVECIIRTRSLDKHATELGRDRADRSTPRDFLSVRKREDGMEWDE